MDPLTLETWYRRASKARSDIARHLETLVAYGKRCKHLTEFGVRRGNSTSALLYSRPDHLVSYDRVIPNDVADWLRAATADGVDWVFRQADTLMLSIEPTDLLLIDTQHTYRQLTAELADHAGRVRQYILMHDTKTFGRRNAGPRVAGPQGLLPAIDEFLDAHPAWRVRERFDHSHGLTVLERKANAGADL